MSAEKYRDSFSRELVRSSAKVAATGVAAGLVGVAGITIRHHRELTHKSLELSERLQKAIDLEQRSLGVKEAGPWASVHEIHHAMRDATLFPFYRIYHAIEEAKTRGIPIPDSFLHLDPGVDQFDRKTVETIGRMADTLVKDRLKHLYKPPAFTEDAEILKTLNPTEAQYHYPKRVRKNSAGEYTADELARLLLTDPHSPPLMRGENGVQSVAKSNISLYQVPADAFRFIPSIKPEHLQRPEDFQVKNEGADWKTRRAVIGGFAIPIAAMYAINRDYTWKGFGKAILEGAAINGIRIGTEVVGGNVTNSAGHMGDPVQTEIAQAFLNRTYKIKLKSDGTYSTNTVGKGLMGKLASWATLDEVGGQEVHHEKPWKIAYTDAEGRQAVIEAPWGSLLEYLAKNDSIADIKRGEGFGGKERPDVVHPAVKLIEDKRAEQYKRDYPNGETDLPKKSKNIIHLLFRKGRMG